MWGRVFSASAIIHDWGYQFMFEGTLFCVNDGFASQNDAWAAMWEHVWEVKQINNERSN